MKILFITLSNLGDVIMTLPCIDILFEEFDSPQIYCICADKVKNFVGSIEGLYKVISYKKKQTPSQWISFLEKLREEYFDVIIDLKNSLLPLFLKAKKKTPLFLQIPPNLHSVEKFKLILEKTLKKRLSFSDLKRTFKVDEGRKKELLTILNSRNTPSLKRVFLGIGARSHIKRYPASGFSYIIEKLNEENFIPVVVGDENDKEIAFQIKTLTKAHFLDLCGKFSLQEIGAVLKEVCFATITCDSAFLHLSSYLNIPTLGIFGPTSPVKYGPWGKYKEVVFKQDLKCRPCQKSLCKYKWECMKTLEPQEVWRKFQCLIGSLN
ncbi:MAG: hypothetical protein B6D55_06605 [Candidatus Omnitrophica bacterium 4484_70.2]|nr:MAG: hypothetical protein B6D55_06605 [Candidatus Omnitrophica bacterium 4484_70.2]